MNDEEWAGVVAALALAWEDLPDPAALRGWRQWLGPWPAPLVIGAIQSLAEEGERFRPLVGQVVKRCRELERPPYPTFAEVYDGLHNMAVGASWTRPPEELPWPHPLMGQVASMIGWNTFMNSNEGDPAMRAHVRRCYDDLIQRGEAAMTIDPALIEELNTLPEGWEKIGAPDGR